MKTYVVLLRGINVSGQKKIPMADLRSLMNRLGFEQVQTYIQSGNIVLQSSESNSEIISATISEGILKRFGFQVPVLVISKTDLEKIFEGNPFPEAQKETSYFTLLHECPKSELVEALMQEQFEGEVFVIDKNCVYLQVARGYGTAKCNNNFFERKLGLTATTRNFKTMQKLLSLCSDL